MAGDEEPAVVGEDMQDMLRQARQMQTAYGVIVAMYGGLSLDTITEGVVRNLVEVGGLRGADVDIDARFEGIHVRSAASAGERSGREHRVPVIARSVEVGTLTVFHDDERTVDEIQALLDYVMPTTSITIDNAIAFLEVMDYRRNLEDKVVERTAQLAEAHAQLARSLDDVRDAKAARDRFFANINHEIRTPLTLILLAVDGIERSGDALTGGTVNKLDEVKGGTRRLLHLVNSLLQLAAGDEGKTRIRPGPVDVVAVVERLVRGWQSAAEKGQIEIVYRGPSACPATMDQDALETIVGNFVSNAVKFTPPAGRITITLVASEDRVAVTVRDTGPGIDPDFIPKLFGRFERSQTAVTRGVRGTGIGLALSKELVDLQGGDVKVLTHDDPRGTSFTMWVPRHQAVTAVLPTEQPRSAGADTVPRELAPAAPTRSAPAPEAARPRRGDDPVASPRTTPGCPRNIAVRCSARSTECCARPTAGSRSSSRASTTPTCSSPTSRCPR